MYCNNRKVWKEVRSAATTKYGKKEVEKIHQFLVGLNAETYGNVRSQILNLEPLLSMITQEERQRSIARGRKKRSKELLLLLEEEP